MQSACGARRACTAPAVRRLRAGEVRLVLVGGGPGTGKTTLAGALADRLGAVTLNSDRIRRELTGLAPEMSAAAAYRHGICTTGWTDRTYRELIDRARRLLERGETVAGRLATGTRWPRRSSPWK